MLDRLPYEVLEDISVKTGSIRTGPSLSMTCSTLRAAMGAHARRTSNAIVSSRFPNKKLDVLPLSTRIPTGKRTDRWQERTNNMVAGACQRLERAAASSMLTSPSDLSMFRVRIEGGGIDAAIEFQDRCMIFSTDSHALSVNLARGLRKIRSITLFAVDPERLEDDVIRPAFWVAHEHEAPSMREEAFDTVACNVFLELQDKKFVQGCVLDEYLSTCERSPIRVSKLKDPLDHGGLSTRNPSRHVMPLPGAMAAMTAYLSLIPTNIITVDLIRLASSIAKP